VITLVGLKRASIYKLMHANKFPRPIKIGLRAVAWDSRAIGRWISEQINGKAAA
jgi:prophage regulatory protein